MPRKQRFRPWYSLPSHPDITGAPSRDGRAGGWGVLGTYFVAVLAEVGLVARVDALVGVQIAGPRECHVAELAVERFLARVRPLVGHQRGPHAEPPMALPASVPASSGWSGENPRKTGQNPDAAKPRLGTIQGKQRFKHRDKFATEP